VSHEFAAADFHEFVSIPHGKAPLSKFNTVTPAVVRYRILDFLGQSDSCACIERAEKAAAGCWRPPPSKLNNRGDSIQLGS
jgi:hypothetical protein